MATGWAIGRGEPALAILHTTAGLGNAVGALATARVNRAPLVVVVGQQDRRHLASEPFLAGKLQGLAGEYPVWVDQPVRPQDVPGAIARAVHESVTGSGPALVIVPMDDWAAEAAAADERAAPRSVVRARTADSGAVEQLAALFAASASPALVVGSGADDPETWRALVDARRTARVPGLAGVVQCPSRVPPGSSAVCRPPPGRSRPPARDARAARSRARRGRAGVPAVPVHRGPLRRDGDDRRDDQRRSRRGAPQLGSARRAGRAGIRLRRARARRSAAHGCGAGRASRAASAVASRAGRADARRTRLRRDRGADPAQRDRDRGVALEPARADRAPARARVARLR